MRASPGVSAATVGGNVEVDDVSSQHRVATVLVLVSVGESGHTGGGGEKGGDESHVTCTTCMCLYTHVIPLLLSTLNSAVMKQATGVDKIFLRDYERATPYRSPLIVTWEYLVDACSLFHDSRIKSGGQEQWYHVHMYIFTCVYKHTHVVIIYM